MTQNMFAFCDEFTAEFEKCMVQPRAESKGPYYTGIDLGTACVVLAVLDQNRRPAAGAMRWANVVRDGMVVYYMGAIRLVREMKQELEEKLGTELLYASAALPPGTQMLDGGAVRNVVQAAGFEVTAMLDEPTAANSLLRLKDGAIVDIGGGTTGIAIVKGGRILKVDDEPTGGTHFSLVLAGALGMKYEEAELYKRDERNHREIFPVVRPVIAKIASLIGSMTQGYDVPQLVLVGGSSCLTGIDEEIGRLTGIRTYKPSNPLFTTPLGIALSCTEEIL